VAKGAGQSILDKMSKNWLPIWDYFQVGEVSVAAATFVSAQTTKAAGT